MRLLKQSTATTLLLGPFVDETDGKTAETALSITQALTLLWKEGGTTLAQKSETTTATHRSNGLYTTPINTTDTNTLGILTVSATISGAIPVRQDYYVVPAVTYDTFVTNGLLSLFTQTLTQSYASDGNPPTVTQALMLIQQALTEFAIVGTALTIKKLDGSTTAAVLTLDDASNPTLATRTS